MNIYRVPYYSNSGGGLQSLLVEAMTRDEAGDLATHHEYFEQSAGVASPISEREYRDLDTADLRNIHERTERLRAKMKAEAE